jgi:CRISPR/Cas system-associated exonuclease Cas4 (RecB family)
MDINKQLCEQYLEEKFDKAVWSPSRIKTFYDCPLKWYENYVLGISHANFDAHNGTAVHDTMEEYYRYRLNGGLEIELNTLRGGLVSKYKKKLAEALRTTPVPLPWYANSSINKVSHAIRNHFTPREDITDVEREYFFEIGKHKFRGFIDFDCGDEIHGDYKSKWTPKMYREQQFLYAYAKEMNTGVRPKGFVIVEYKKEFNEVFVPYDKNMVDYVLQWASYGIREIRRALERGEFKAISHSDFFCTSLCRSTECPIFGETNKM